MARILIVDDDVDGSQALAGQLSHDGHDPDQVHDGRAALETIVAHPPALVILDIRMPEMDGIGVLEVLRSYRRLAALPVVTLAAHYTDHDLSKAEELGVLKLFQKGTDTPETVCRWIEGYLAAQ